MDLSRRKLLAGVGVTSVGAYAWTSNCDPNISEFGEADVGDEITVTGEVFGTPTKADTSMSILTLGVNSDEKNYRARFELRNRNEMDKAADLSDCGTATGTLRSVSDSQGRYVLEISDGVVNDSFL